MVASNVDQADTVPFPTEDVDHSCDNSSDWLPSAPQPITVKQPAPFPVESNLYAATNEEPAPITSPISNQNTTDQIAIAGQDVIEEPFELAQENITSIGDTADVLDSCTAGNEMREWG